MSEDVTPAPEGSQEGVASVGGDVKPVIDLTPREVAVDAATSKRRWPLVAGVGVILGLVVVVGMGLNSATVYFKYVDEAVAERADLGDDFFRMQGNVVDGSVSQTSDGARFTMRRHGTSADVIHTGAEPALFGDPQIPVVVEGHWDGDTFQSQRIIVNHDATYTEANEDRLTEAKTEAQSEAQSEAGTGQTSNPKNP